LELAAAERTGHQICGENDPMKRHVGARVLSVAAVFAGALALGPAPGFAASFTAIYSFGDSLSDVGNVYAASLGLVPIPPYYDGRFSNGPNWLDDLSAKLGLGPVVASADGGNDFAVGGAQTGPTAVGSTVVNPGVPLVDLIYQVKEFKILDPLPTAGALYTLDIGANDIGNAISTFGDNTADLEAFLSVAVANTVGAVDALYADGARSLLYYEVPDLSLVPAFEAGGALGGELAAQFNADVLAGIKPLEAEGLTVYDIPIFRAIEDIVKDPAAFGLTNVTSQCFSGDYDTPGTECADPSQYLFWDDEHPTAAAHAITADIAYDVLTGAADPIAAPEPSTWAMLLIGFAGLGLMGWRARRPVEAKAA
jgi:phospholipase/lecithinase/hemolysin